MNKTTVSLEYFFNAFLFEDLFKGIVFIVVYSMFILSSRNQPRENKSSRILKYAGIYGIAVSILSIVHPTVYCLNCTPSEFFVAITYGTSIAILFQTPTLVCLGISLFLVGKRNKDIYGRKLMISGIFSIIIFFGYNIGYLALRFNMWMLIPLGVVSYLLFPAAILIIIHGVKLKDKHFLLSGVF